MLRYSQSLDSNVEELSILSMPNRKSLRLPDDQIRHLLYLAHINTVLYSTCFWIQQGMLPYLTQKLGIDSDVFGYLQTTFAVVQLAGGPLYGRLGDKFGARFVLSLAFLSAACSYSILAVANSAYLVFLSRIPSVFLHAVQGGQMLVTNISSPSERAKMLAQLGISYGIGMVLGPSLGGIITQYSMQAAAWTAVAGSLLSLILSLVLIPGDIQKQSDDVEQQKKESTTTSSFIALIWIERVAILLGIKCISGIPIGMFQSMFPVLAIEYFHMTAAENGYIMSYIGILAMLIQGFSIGPLNRRFSENALMKMSILALIVSYALMTLVTHKWHLYLNFIPLTFGLTILNVIISSSLTKSVKPCDTGFILGVNMAVNSAIRTISPSIGGILYKHYGFLVFGYVGFILNSILVICLHKIFFKTNV